MISILIAGSGGQGILFLGKLIAHSSMLNGKNVTWFPSYGAEMRGGTANCTVVISDDIIGSPIVTNPDILIVMNTASLRRFEERLKKNGLLVMDSSMTKEPPKRDDIHIVKVPATEIAVSLGNIGSANMVLFGALLNKTELFNQGSITSALKELTSSHKKRLLEINKTAIKKGIKYHD